MSDDGSWSRPKLTAKQLRFVAAYLDPAAANGNGTLAARMAGYKGNNDQLGVQAWANLRNPRIQRLITDSLVAPAMMTVCSAFGATKSKHFLAKDGTLISTDPEPDHKIRLQAAECVFKLRAKADDVDGSEEEQADDDAALQLEDLDPADQQLHRHVYAIEAQLAELEPSGKSGDKLEPTTEQVAQAGNPQAGNPQGGNAPETSQESTQGEDNSEKPPQS
jgi:phage terminase small subunit